MRVLIFLIAAVTAFCQPGTSPQTSTSSQPSGSSQISKQLVLGKTVATTLEQRDGKLEDPAILSYLGTVVNRLAKAAGNTPPEVRITRGNKQYAQLLPGALYISAAMLERIENEAELAGLLAHELAHGSGLTPTCVLSSPAVHLSVASYREAEMQSTISALGTLKAAGYDPTEMLSLLSKLAYEHPAWSKAIVPDDLLDLRVRLEAETLRPSGYEVDTSEFRTQHARLVQLLGHAKKLTGEELVSHPKLQSQLPQPHLFD
jgi:predicted Zn-dependent protease